MIKRKWEIPETDHFLEEKLSKSLQISPILTKVMINRGLTDPSQIQDFINANLNSIFNHDPRSLYHPSTMLGMDRGVERIISSIVHKEIIAIHGDYDVDGITGTSLLHSFFSEIQVESFYYIPRRIEEGYDISKESVDRIKERGASLIVTTDCGISAIEPIAYAKTQGIDVIITDHHQPPEHLPEAYTIINPKQSGCPFVFKDLAGVGVTYYLVIALRSKLREKGFFEFHMIEEPNLKKYLEFVAIGTIADIVPLREINRVFVKHGLAELNKTQKPGVVALKELANCKEKEVTSSIVGYQMAPRLNAAGRIGEAIKGVELLTAPSYSDAHILAENLEQQNRKRQEIEAGIFEEAIDKIASDGDFEKKRSLVLVSPNWHPGVIGIVASRLVERFYKPTILISFMGGEGKGSGRSIKGLNIYEMILQCSNQLENFGGHEYAVGLTISVDKLESFIADFEKVVSENFDKGDFTPILRIDAELSTNSVTLDLIRELRKLEPFGHSNKEPIFSFQNVMIQHKEIAGKRHLKLKLSLDNRTFDAIGFNLAEAFYAKLKKFQLIEIAFIPQINDFYGEDRIQLRIVDIKA